MSEPKRDEKRDGFYIGGTSLFFPLIPVDKFKKGDAKLIEAVTGKDWNEWVKLLADHGLAHEFTQQGFLAVSIQRARKATADEVVRFIDDLPLVDGIELYFAERPDGEGEERPPAEETAG